MCLKCDTACLCHKELRTYSQLKVTLSVIFFASPGGMKVYNNQVMPGQKTVLWSPVAELGKCGLLKIQYRVTDKIKKAKLNIYLHIGGSSYAKVLLLSASGKNSCEF